MSIYKFLEIIFVIQRKQYDDKGALRGEYKRVNPWNPISYLVVLLFFIGALLCYGFVGMWSQVDTVNPFRWQ